MSEAAIAPPPAAPVETAPPASASTTTPAAAPPVGFMGTPVTPPGSPPPAAAPSTFFGDHVQEGGAFKEGWTESLRAAGFERLANKAAFAKDEATLLKTLDETIGFVGKKAVGATYPKEGASDEEISAFRHSAGVPDSPDAYNLKPETLPAGLEWNDAEAKQYAEILHKHHVPEAAARDLMARHLESAAALANSGMEQFTAKVSQFAQASEQTYQKEWGEHYDSRLEANRTFVSSRFDANELGDPVLQAALSHPKIVRMIDEARRALREAPLPGVGQELSAGSHSPRQQAQEIMKANPAWRNDAALAKRVGDLYALDAAQAKRAKR